LYVAEALSAQGVRLEHGSFEIGSEIAVPGDFLYIDPPYVPVSRTANFTSYTAAGFDAAAQERLQKMVIELAERRCHVLLSNSTAPQVSALYDTNRATREAGLRALRVPARRAINSNSARRGSVEEYLITNIPEPDRDRTSLPS
jgi:DNA adenine methylase